MKKLRICFVTEDFYPSFIGGQGIYGWKFVSQLAKKTHTVTVLAEKRSRRREFWEREKNVSILLVPFCFGNQIILSLLEYCIFQIRLRKEYFDILHANQLSGLFFVLFKPKNVGKILISVHNTNSDMAQKTKSPIKKFLYQPFIFLERILYERADGILFNSPDEKKDLLNYFKIKNKPTKIVYLGVEFPTFSLQEQQKARLRVRKELNIKADAKIVLYVGRLVKRKNVDVLLKSLALLNGKNIIGVIIGKGIERQRLEKMAPNNVCFPGFVKDTMPYYLAADIFVTVSQAEGGFLLSALEAASFGLPLILSPSTAGFPILKEGINGFVVEPNDVDNLVKKITLALDNSGRMSKNSLKYAKVLTWEKCVTETLIFYQQLAQKQLRIG